RPKRTRLGLLALGIILIAGAWWVRQSVLAARSASHRADAAVVDANKKASAARLEARAADLESRVAAAPNDVGLHQELLLLYQRMGNPVRATDHLAAIAKLKPQDEDASRATANARLALKQWSPAESAYRNHVQRWPKSADGWQGLSAALFHESRYRE